MWALSTGPADMDVLCRGSVCSTEEKEKHANVRELDTRLVCTNLPGTEACPRPQNLAQVLLTMRFGSTAKVLLKCNLKYYRISECFFFLVDKRLTLAISRSIWRYVCICSSAQLTKMNVAYPTQAALPHCP